MRSFIALVAQADDDKTSAIVLAISGIVSMERVGGVADEKPRFQSRITTSTGQSFTVLEDLEEICSIIQRKDA